MGIMHHHCVPLRRRPPNIINFSLHSHIMTKGPMCINTVFISPLPCNEHRNSNRVVFTLPTIALYPYVYIVAFFFSVGLVFHVSYACMHMYICIHTYIYICNIIRIVIFSPCTLCSIFTVCKTEGYRERERERLETLADPVYICVAARDLVQQSLPRLAWAELPGLSSPKEHLQAPSVVVHVQGQRATSMHTHMHTQMHTCTHAHAHMQTNARTCTHMHTPTHTHPKHML